MKGYITCLYASSQQSKGKKRKTAEEKDADMENKENLKVSVRGIIDISSGIMITLFVIIMDLSYHISHPGGQEAKKRGRKGFQGRCCAGGKVDEESRNIAPKVRSAMSFVSPWEPYNTP